MARWVVDIDDDDVKPGDWLEAETQVRDGRIYRYGFIDVRIIEQVEEEDA